MSLKTTRTKRLRRMGGISVAAVLIYLAATRGLYFFPVSVALGPCLPDWTSPSTYLAIFEDPASPMRKTRFTVSDAEIQICYGSPSAKGRRVFERDRESERAQPDSILVPGAGTSSNVRASASTGPAALVPNDRLWRLGANEPTRIFTNRSIQLGTLTLQPGRYSMYAIPGNEAWEIFLTRSIHHWGNQISNRVRRMEVGSTRIGIVATKAFEESLVFTAVQTAADSVVIAIRWANVEVPVPVKVLSENNGTE